jgi:hypothetical protein
MCQTNHNSTCVHCQGDLVLVELRWPATSGTTFRPLGRIRASPLSRAASPCKTNEGASCCIIGEGLRCEARLHRGSLCGLRSASPTIIAHRRQGSIPMSRTYNWCGSNPPRASPSRIEIGPLLFWVWYWSFGGRAFLCLLEKTSPSPSNAWPPKLSAKLVVFCGDLIVMLHGLIFKVGPLSPLWFQPILVSRRESWERFFTPTIYSRRGCGLLLPLTGSLPFLHLLSRVLCSLPSFASLRFYVQKRLDSFSR